MDELGHEMPDRNRRGMEEKTKTSIQISRFGMKAETVIAIKIQASK